MALLKFRCPEIFNTFKIVHRVENTLFSHEPGGLDLNRDTHRDAMIYVVKISVCHAHNVFLAEITEIFTK